MVVDYGGGILRWIEHQGKVNKPAQVDGGNECVRLFFNMPLRFTSSRVCDRKVEDEVDLSHGGWMGRNPKLSGWGYCMVLQSLVWKGYVSA